MSGCEILDGDAQHAVEFAIRLPNRGFEFLPQHLLFWIECGARGLVRLSMNVGR
jgi:hypothetical protein